MKTIVQIVQHLTPGGIESLSLDLHNHYQQEGNHSIIISLEGDESTLIAAWPRLNAFKKSIIFLNKPKQFSLVFLYSLMCLLHRLKANVIHTHHIGPLIYGALASFLIRHKTHIHTEHDAWHLEITKHQKIQNLVFGWFKPKVIADALFVAQSMQKYLKPYPISIIKNGIDSERFIEGNKETARTKLGLENNIKLIGCSARLEKVKGHNVLIDTLKLLQNNIHLALAGSGSEEKSLKEQVRQLGLSKRVHFLGQIDEMPTFYQALDCFCLPSFNEGMPLSPLEAQACAVPVVVTHTGGSKESVCPRTGCLVKVGDVLDLKQAIEMQLHKKKTINPRQFVLDHASLSEMAQSYSKLYLGAKCV